MKAHLPLFLLLLSCLHNEISYSAPTFNAIFSWGASYEDTGNIAILAPTSPAYQPLLNPPYGETYFHHPTGRASNGRLVIDRIGSFIFSFLFFLFLRIKERYLIVSDIVAIKLFYFKKGA
jgi:hypothetical protein